MRFDRFDQTLTDMLANTRQVQRHSAASPRLGLTYSYWQMDARTRFMLEVHNLFDKTYYAASWGALTVSVARWWRA